MAHTAIKPFELETNSFAGASMEGIFGLDPKDGLQEDGMNRERKPVSNRCQQAGLTFLSCAQISIHTYISPRWCSKAEAGQMDKPFQFQQY
jgi:hypothetical protein